MQGLREPALPLLRARLTRPFRQKPGLTRFLPARLSADGATIEPGVSHGSGRRGGAGALQRFSGDRTGAGGMGGR